MKKGVELILEERQKQIDKGYDVNHDMHHDFRELVRAASTYIDAAILTAKSKEIGNSDEAAISWHEYNEPFEWKYLKLGWPWEEESFKPTTSLEDLIKAGALIAAAIDRLQKDNELAEKQKWIENACEWFKNNASNYIIEHPFSSDVDFEEDKMIGDFKKYVKGE